MPELDRRSLLFGGIAAPALLSATVLSTTAALAAPTASLRKRVSAQMAAAHIPGLMLTAILDGRTILADGFGVASPAFNVAATDRTLFHLGSVGKHFTA